MTYSELRASDTERERVITFLREHALLGRLSDDELEERIGLAYAAITVGDLEALIGDLPRGNRPPSRPAPPRHEPRAMQRKRNSPPPALIGVGLGALLLTGLPIVALVGVVAVFITLAVLVFALGVVFGPPLLVALLIIAAAKRRRPQRRQHMRWGPTY
jgi:hypothetical protein